MVKRKEFDFLIPKELNKNIEDLLFAAKNNLTYDCELEELRTTAHTMLDDEKSETVLNYYYRSRKWLREEDK